MKFKRHCPISELQFNKQIGEYLLSVKIGDYYEFNSFSLSNQLHHHECYELVIVLEGDGFFTDNDTVKTLGSGDIFLSNPYRNHEIHINQTESLKVFYAFFTIETQSGIRRNSFEEQLIKKFLHYHESYAVNCKEILAYFQFIDVYKIRTTITSDPWLLKLLVNMLLQCMTLLLGGQSTHYQGTIQTTVSTFEWILDYIDQNIHTRITATDIANATNVSRSTLYKMFDQNLQRTVHDYIKERKIAMAKHYLTLNISITEVAGLIGMGSPSYFSRIFKSYTGLSPKAYIQSRGQSPFGQGRRI